jgi:hypothetical protein
VLDHANFAQYYVHNCSSLPPISLLAFVAADLGHLIVIPLFSSPFSYLPFRHSISVRQSSFSFFLKTTFFLVLDLTVMPGADQSCQIRTGNNLRETHFYSTISGTGRSSQILIMSSHDHSCDLLRVQTQAFQRRNNVEGNKRLCHKALMD